MKYRIGQGYDVHRLVEGRELIIGGVCIEHYRGLLGHSDADVLLHAIIDAILGALGEADIGSHFPDNNPVYKNVDSRVLLREISEMVRQRGLRIENLDTTVIAQKPRLRRYVSEMNENIAADLNLEKNCVNVKATTTEGIGLTGREEGIAATAVVLIAMPE